eukprot:115084-Chlamydomonas_euryale.AAC.2
MQACSSRNGSCARKIAACYRKCTQTYTWALKHLGPDRWMAGYSPLRASVAHGLPRRCGQQGVRARGRGDGVRTGTVRLSCECVRPCMHAASLIHGNIRGVSESVFHPGARKGGRGEVRTAAMVRSFHTGPRNTGLVDGHMGAWAGV